MELVNREQCTGCGACMKACPKQAIAFRDDGEGFPTPVIRKDRCVECGLCNRVCPALNPPATHGIQAAYAAQIRDREALRESTSGGIFTALAREIFSRGGVVYGCVWDGGCNAVVRKAEREEEIAPMRGSKYVWSWAGDTFPEIRALLEAGRTVMFTGQPCQVAGLKKYLNRDYDNLYTVDFLCSGTPSPLALRRYVETICSPDRLPGLDLKFRDKDPYGVGVHITYNGDRPKKPGRDEHVTNPYYYAFYTHLTTRRCCYRCAYRGEDRVSELTICDYWGVRNYHPDMDIRSGVSAVMVNSDRGAALLDAVGAQVQLVKTRNEHVAASNNLSLGGAHKVYRAPASREAFFRTLEAEGWTAAERRYLINSLRFKHYLKSKLPRSLRGRIKKIVGRR